MNATLICFDEDGNEIKRGPVEIKDHDIESFDPMFEGAPMPHHMKVEYDDGELYVCLSAKDFYNGTPNTGDGANSINYGGWEDYLSRLTCDIPYDDCCEVQLVLYPDEIEPFTRSL